MAFKVIHPHTSTGTTETIKTRIGKGEIAIQHPAAGDASLFTIDANGDAVEFISGAAVDKKIGGKNVSASGDAYVSATASANNVTVAATTALTSAVTKANSAVQCVNGHTGTDVSVTKADLGLENVNNTADIDKKVATAQKWATARTLTLASGANGSVGIDGSADVTLNVTSLAASAVTGVLGLAQIPNLTIDKIPKAAIERLFIAATEAKALELDVEEGDTVKVTGNHDKMYFCVNAKATTFAEKFTEYTASTHWDVIQGKPNKFTPDTHSHKSSDISSMSGYSKASTVTAISTGDTLNTAIGKLETALDGKMSSGTSVVNKISGLNGEVTIKAGSNINVTTASTSTEKSITIANTYSYTHPATHPASMITGLATVATSGSYNDLKDKPTIDNTHHQAKNVVCAATTGQTAAAAANGNVHLNLVENDAVRSSINIKGTGSATVTSDADGNITVSATDTNHNTTSEAGHYTPTGSTNPVTPAAGSAVSWSGKVITAITLDSKKHVTGITTGAIPANPNTDSKVADTPSEDIAFILGHHNQSSTAAAVSNAGAYMQKGILYSQSVPVLTCTVDGKVSPSGLTDRDVILDCGTF